MLGMLRHTTLKSFSIPRSAINFFILSRKFVVVRSFPLMLIGIFEVVSEPFKDESRIFTGGLYPWRIKIKLIKLGEVEFKPLIPKLKFIKNKDK